MHVLVEALALEDPIAKVSIIKGLVAEAPAPLNPTAGMVQKCTMALDQWFLAAQLVGNQVVPRPHSQ